jgi:hypothetical protein
MFNLEQFKELIIKPTLLDLQSFSEEAIELLIFTCAVESEGGTYLKQINGPACGIYQMEPDTYYDIWEHYLKNNNYFLQILTSNFNVGFIPSHERLIYDLRYATAMARIFYLRIEEPIPAAKDTEAMWNYYKKYYNTEKGKAEKIKSICHYKFFINN